MTDQEARARFIDSMMKLTVWIRQATDGRWEAIDYHGKLVTTGKFRASVEYEVRTMAADPSNFIYATAIIVDPRDRQPKRKSRGTRRMF